MTSDYKEYLAVNVLGDSRVITYRLLSRALKVHVNAAKQMLYEFHQQQNAKKQGSIHATYLLSGIRRNEEAKTISAGKQDGDDVHMRSSAFISSSMPQVEEEDQEITAVQTIILAKEEDLDQVVSSFERLSSIHIYSLESAPLHDLQALSDAAREVLSVYGHEDPMEHGPIYGTIHNKDVRRRSDRRPPSQNMPALKTQKQQITKDSKLASQTSTTIKSSQPPTAKDFSKTQNDKRAIPQTSQNPTSSAPALKRDSSSIFKAFAKAKPKSKVEPTDSSVAPSTQASAAEDSPMKDVSDDDEDDYVPPPQASKENVDRDRQARKEREAALKKMMEDDDEPEPESVSHEIPVEIDEPEVMVDTPAVPEPEPVVEVENGRRRGKRRVMKKRTMKDEEGYLVTKEEAVWESFSEDEPVVTKPKLPSTTSSTGAKKKPAVKTGQGSIMSFFGKK